MATVAVNPDILEGLRKLPAFMRGHNRVADQIGRMLSVESELPGHFVARLRDIDQQLAAQTQRFEAMRVALHAARAEAIASGDLTPEEARQFTRGLDDGLGALPVIVVVGIAAVVIAGIITAGAVASVFIIQAEETERASARIVEQMALLRSLVNDLPPESRDAIARAMAQNDGDGGSLGPFLFGSAAGLAVTIAALLFVINRRTR